MRYTLRAQSQPLALVQILLFSSCRVVIEMLQLGLDGCSCNCFSQGKIVYTCRFLSLFASPRQTSLLKTRPAVDLELEVLVLNSACLQIHFDYRTP